MKPTKSFGDKAFGGFHPPYWDRLLDPGGLVLAGLAKSLELLAASTLAGLLVVGFATHFLAEAAPFAQLAEASYCFLDRLAGTHP